MSEEQQEREAALGMLHEEVSAREGFFLRRVYVEAAGGDIHAGMLLSQLMYWNLPAADGRSKLRINRDGHQWLAKRHSDWKDEIYLTSSQSKRAADILLGKTAVPQEPMPTSETRGKGRPPREGHVIEPLIATTIYKFAGTPMNHYRILWTNLRRAVILATQRIYAEKVVLEEAEKRARIVNAEMDAQETLASPQEVASLILNRVRPQLKIRVEPDLELGTFTETTTEITTNIIDDSAKNALSCDAENASPITHEEQPSLKAENKDTRSVDNKRDAVDIPAVIHTFPASAPVLAAPILSAPALVLAAAVAEPALMATLPINPVKPRKPIVLRAKPECPTAMLAREFFQAAKLPYTQSEFRRAQKEFRELTKPHPEFRTFNPEVIRDCIHLLAEHGVEMTGPGLIARVIVAFVADDAPFPPTWCTPKTQRLPKKERERLAEYRRLSNLPITPNNLEAGYAAVAAKRASQGLRSETLPTRRAASQQTTDSGVL